MHDRDKKTKPHTTTATKNHKYIIRFPIYIWAHYSLSDSYPIYPLILIEQTMFICSTLSTKNNNIHEQIYLNLIINALACHVVYIALCTYFYPFTTQHKFITTADVSTNKQQQQQHNIKN